MARVLSSLSNSDRRGEAVIETFLVVMDTIARNMVHLREEAEISLGHLMRLQEQLVVLHEATLRNFKELEAMVGPELPPELRSLFDLATDRILREVDPILDLLKNVEKYRMKGLSHITATLETLHTLDADMEELRTRVAAPDIVRDKIPIEAQIKSIKAGVDGLKEGRMRASLRQRDGIAKILEIGT